MASVYHKYLRKGEAVPPPSKEQLEREESAAQLIRERTRKERALADLREAEFRRKRGQLIERCEAVHQASFLFAAIRWKLLALPTLVARRLEVPDRERHAAKLVVDSTIREVLTELAALPSVITREQWEAFEAETPENAEKQSKQPPRRKASRS
jgi:hypothetical protein